MQDEVLPVQGIFLDPAWAAKAADSLRGRGLAVEMSPLAETNPAVFALTRPEAETQFLHAIAGEWVGLLVGASLGALLGAALTSAVVGVLAAIVFAFAGALTGLWLGDRPPDRYRDYVRHGGIVLAVRCTGEQQDSVLSALKQAHAVEVNASSHG